MTAALLILLYLAKNGPSKSDDVVSAIGTHEGTLRDALSKQVARGHATATQIPNTHARIYVITPAGREVLAKAEAKLGGLPTAPKLGPSATFGEHIGRVRSVFELAGVVG